MQSRVNEVWGDGDGSMFGERDGGGLRDQGEVVAEGPQTVIPRGMSLGRKPRHTDLQERLERGPPLVHARLHVEAAGVNDLVGHVDLLLLDEVSHERLHRVLAGATAGRLQLRHGRRSGVGALYVRYGRQRRR